MRTAFFIMLSMLSFAVMANQAEPVIKDYGFFYEVPEHDTIAPDTKFKIAFDVADGAEHGKLNGHINSLARFINMHVAHGIKKENIELALVIHGSASVDVLKSQIYQQRFGSHNENQNLIAQLLENNTKVYVCGQSATHYKVGAEQLIPGVKMALSAMTAHAQLQHKGYTLNPF